MKPTMLIVSLVLFVAGCAQGDSAPPLFETAEVSRNTIAVSVSAAGVVEPMTTVEVKSKASGEVLDVSIENGDFVEEGTLIVQIDPRTVQNRLAQAEAELVAAEASRKIAQTQMERADRLHQSGTLSEADVETAELDLANAQAQVVTARVAVENARIAVDDTDVRAPISGTVLNKPVEKGQVISSPTQDVGGGTVLLSMADLSAVQIRALVDETDIGKIQPGIRATVLVAAYPNQPFEGVVSKIEPQAVDEEAVTMFAVLIDIENADGLLLPGMNAEVDVMIARRESVNSVPVMALRTERDVYTTAAILGLEASELYEQIRASSAQLSDLEEDKAYSITLNGSERSGGVAIKQDSETEPGADSRYRFGGQFWVVLDNGEQPSIQVVHTGLTDLDQVEIVSGLDETDSVLVLPSSHLIETQQDLQSFIQRRISRATGFGG
ncbi:MAG: efflux RND transporter periplasmic adaptor subunit [Pseudomonadota bacterium]